jgi:hypothetical protein
MSANPDGAGLQALAFSLHRRGGTGVSLLAIHAPVAEFIERDWLACHGAAHVGAWTENAKIAVKKFNFRFARVDRTPIESVHFKDPDLVILWHDGCGSGTATLAPRTRKRSGQEIARLLNAPQLALRGVSGCARQFSIFRGPTSNTG